MAVSVVDLESRRVPNRIVVPGLVAALVVRTALDPSPRWIGGAAVAGGALLALALIYPAGLGMGDVKLAAFLGGWLAWHGVLALVLGSFAASSLRSGSSRCADGRRERSGCRSRRFSPWAA